MLQRVLFAVILVGLLASLYTCGRARTPQAADTPVPTLTPLATMTASATHTATADAQSATVMESATAAAMVEISATAAMDATPVITATDEVSAPVGVEASATITTGAEMTATVVPITRDVVTGNATITVTVTATATDTVTDTVTASEVMTEAASAAVSTTAVSPTAVAPANTATRAPSATPRLSNTPQPSRTPTSTPTSSQLPSQTPAPTIASTATVMVSATASVTASITATDALTVTDVLTTSTGVTASATVTATVVVSESVAATPTVDAAGSGASGESREGEIVPRQPITLPAQLATSVQISKATFLTALVPDALPMAAELAPDGEAVAWLVPEAAQRSASLCVASLATSEQDCFTVEGFQGLPYRLAWSPDGSWIAFSEDPSAQALESDLWLFDVERGEGVQRTDDGAEGRHADATGEFVLDYLPMWDAATGDLYFWRSTQDAQGEWALALMRLDPGTQDEAVLVRDLGQSLGDGLVRFGWQRFYLHGPAAIAPDGSQVVVSIAAAQEMDVSSSHALWLIDLTDEEAEPRQLANALAWQRALPQWSNQPASVRGVQWTDDGKGIVVAALSSDLRLPLLLAYYVDVASGEVTPLNDFSDSRDRDAFFRLDPTTGMAPRFTVPWTIAVAPNANVGVGVTDLAGGVRIYGVPLPPDGRAPSLLHEHRSPGYEAWTRSSSGGNKLLVYGLLLEIMPVGETVE